MLLPDCVDGPPCRCERLDATLAALREAEHGPEPAPSDAGVAPVLPESGQPSMEPWLGQPAGLIRAAWHEAGHVVAGVLLDGSIQGVDLRMDSRGRVVTRLAAPPADLTLSWLLCRMVSTSAGHLVDQRRGVRSWGGSSEDLDFLDHFATAVAPRCLASQLKARVFDLGRKLVHDAWPGIERVAEALLEVPFALDADRADALCSLGLAGWGSYHHAQLDGLAEELIAALTVSRSAPGSS